METSRRNVFWLRPRMSASPKWNYIHFVHVPPPPLPRLTCNFIVEQGTISSAWGGQLDWWYFWHLNFLRGFMWARANRKTDRQTLKVIYLKVGALIWVFAGTEADLYLQLWTKLYNGGLGAEPQRGQRQSPRSEGQRNEVPPEADNIFLFHRLIS